MSDEGGGPEDGTSVVVVSGDEYSSSVQLQTMESHDLPTELTTADLESLANNPSLWLNLEGSLVGNTELSTLQATEIPSVDIDGLSGAPATITLENISESEMSYVGVESLEEEIIHSQESIETMEISSVTEEPYVQDMECSMEVEIGAHEECEVQASQIVLKPPTPVQQTVTIPSKKTTALPTQYILNQSTGQTILFTSKPSTSTPAPITLTATAGATQSFRLISPAKTLTLAQAQQMGLISPKKGQTLVVNKLAIPSVTKPTQVSQGIKPSPVTVVKSGPAKIAPAPPTSGPTAVTLIGGVQQPIIITANPVSSSQLIMKSSSTPIRMVTAISPNKTVTKPQTGTTFVTARAPGITPARPNTPTTHYIRIPASQALAAGLVPAGPQLQLASGAGKIQLVRLVGSAGVSPNKGPRTVLQGTQMRHIAPLPGTQTIVRMASPHQPGTITKTVVPKGTSVSTASRLLLSATSLMGGGNNGNVVMLPASVLSSSFVTQATAASGIMTTAASRVATATTPSSATQIKPKEPISAKATSSQQSQLQQQSATVGAVGQPAAPQIRAIVESNGLRPRKPCNCTKSQCLKLYCDCFANGEFCYQCNCVNCFNNLSHEEERQKSIKQCLDRNPNAFRPKIGKSSGDSRRHNKGCHCKRSGCLKNYCECYEAKISCTDACRCIGCKNVDECADRKPMKESMELEPRLPTPASRVKVPVSNADVATPHDYLSSSAAGATPGSAVATRGGVGGINTVSGSNVGARPAFSFVTQEVVEATCQCLLARAEEAQEAGKNVADTQLLVLEEFGRCLLQIIDYANKAKGMAGG